MKILIYGRFSSHHYAIRNVITNICYELDKKFDFQNNEILLLSNSSNMFEFKELENIKIVKLDIDPDNAIKNHIYTLFILPKIIKDNNVDLVIFPQITFFYFKRCKIIFYIDDLIEYKVKNQNTISLMLRKFFYKRAVKISDRIITISNNSKKDIIEKLKAKAESIEVLYCGRDKNLKRINKNESYSVIMKQYPILNYRKRFVLYVGYLSHPQKNLLFVIDNIVEILEKYNMQFVLIGPDGKDAQLIHEKIIFENKKYQKNRIIHIGTVNKDLLKYFYSAACCLIFVSQYEGFGMPVIEAMSCGCPVLTSNTSSLKEIAFDYSEMVAPKDCIKFKEKLDNIISGKYEQNKNTEKYLEKFTWRKHVEGLIEIIYQLNKREKI